MKYARSTTKKGLVEEALREFIRRKEAERRAGAYRDRIRALDTKLRGLDLRESPHKVLRDDRERA